MRERARAASEALMVDTVEVSRATAGTFNPATGLIEDGTPTVVYSGPGRLRMPTATETESLFGEQQITKLRFVVDVPHDVTGIAIDDTVTLSESEDASALTRTFIVIAVPSETFNFYRAIGCETVE